MKILTGINGDINEIRKEDIPSPRSFLSISSRLEEFEKDVGTKLKPVERRRS